MCPGSRVCMVTNPKQSSQCMRKLLTRVKSKPAAGVRRVPLNDRQSGIARFQPSRLLLSSEPRDASREGLDARKSLPYA